MFSKKDPKGLKGRESLKGNTRRLTPGEIELNGEKLKVKAASKREQRKSSLLLCRAGAGSSARSAVKG